MSPLVLLGYPASLVMGVALGLTGGGGSILTVPILVYLFGIAALDATSYSLGLVGLVAVWGAWGAYRGGDLNLGRALSFGIPGVVGVLVSRRILLPLLPAQISAMGFSLNQNSLLLIAFALLMLSASFSMIYGARNDISRKADLIDQKKSSSITMSLVGLSVGLVAGFVGAGGGFLIVPALVKFGKLEMKQAVGTSLFVIALQSLLGVLGDYSTLIRMDALLFVSIAVLAIVGMSAGTRLRKNISPTKLKMGFGVFILVIGCLIFVQELSKG